MALTRILKRSKVETEADDVWHGSVQIADTSLLIANVLPQVEAVDFGDCLVQRLVNTVDTGLFVGIGEHVDLDEAADEHSIRVGWVGTSGESDGCVGRSSQSLVGLELV